MWPFTSRRIMGNRWWALAFVGFVCWQVADFAGGLPSAPDNAANATDVTGAPVDDAALKQTLDTLNAM